jgi:hypothetical protein
MQVTNAIQNTKTVADPIAAYESMKAIWLKNKAVCSGERFVKTYDTFLDVFTFTNLLIPFSPSMTPQQYDFYKTEAEFPGITSQYSKLLVGGLLRKQPILKLPKDAPADAMQWIMDGFGQDSSPLISFLDSALWEEVQTGRAWIALDYPKLTDKQLNEMSRPEFLALKPYPILISAESIINWKVAVSANGTQELTQLVIRGFEPDFTQNEFHANQVATVWVHEIVDGKYQIRTYRKTSAEQQIAVINGRVQKDFNLQREVFELKETNTNILINGERMNTIPMWPLNGSIDIVEPMITPFVDREISLYNKLSRRNHLLYGASTYTPIISSDMSDDEFDTITSAGLGSWIRLRQGDEAKVLETPTAALQDMDRAIAATVEDMAKLGMRMLSPETAQSGVALDIRNAAQTAQLGTFNIKVSNQMADIIAFMLNWRYSKEYTSADIEFSLSNDFSSVSMDYNWLRLITEWYQAGLLPRTAWLQILKQNDVMPPDYNDDDGKLEINKDDIINTPPITPSDTSYIDKLQAVG